MHPLVAATSSAIRVWDLDVSNAPGQDSGQQQQQQQQQRSHYGFLSTRAGDYAGPQAQLRVRPGAEHAADSAADAIEAIAAVSWAANGSTFVAGGRGAVIRQYGRAGESLQDVGLGRGMTRDTGMQVVAIQHYGEGSNALFVADNTVRRVRRWDFVKREYTTVCQTHSNPISCMAVCPRKRLVASAAAQGGEIALFNLLHNTQTDLRSATHRALTCIGVAAGHRSLVSVGSEDGLVQVFDAARSSGAPLRTFSRVHTAPLRGIYSHPTSHSTLVSAGLDRRIVVTDVDAYPGASRAKGSLEIVAKAPLTCLARSQDPHAICAGTIDGDVLVYDPRMPAAPLWSGCVRPGHAVVGVDIAQCTAAAPAPSLPLKRPASQDEARPLDRRVARGLPGDGHIVGRLRLDPTGADWPPAAPSATATATATAGRVDAGRRPPQHPSIGRFRAAMSEHRLKAAAAAASRSPKLDPPPPPTTTTTLGQLAAPTRGEAGYPAADGADDMAILAKDRSYMDLLSPTKPADLAPGRIAPLAPARTSPLSILSNGRIDSTPPQREHPGLSLAAELAGASSTPGNAAEATDVEFVSPMPRAWPPHNGQAERSRPRDAGDSMMEMFTPEKKSHVRPAARGLEPMPEPPTATVSGPGQGGSSGSTVKALVSRLLDRHSPTRHSPARHSPARHSSLQRSPEQRNPERQTPDHRSPKHHSPTHHSTKQRTPKHNSPVRNGTAKLKTGLLDASVKEIAPQKAVAATEHTAATSHLEQQSTAATSRLEQQSTAVGAEAPAQRAELGALGSSVLQNAVADALAPLCEQIRGEIRNLHLDMIRQGFVSQEQIKALRQEGGEARALRAEVERLRHENERLRRYVPFFQLSGDDAGGA